MVFLLISQRAKPSSQYNLKDLTGHGRIDVVFRCILAASRPLLDDKGKEIYCFLKGGDPQGWLCHTPDDVSEKDDEISLAAKVKSSWSQYFHEGNLEELIARLPSPRILLSEEGSTFSRVDGTIVLGAQRDLTEEDLELVSPDYTFSLGQRSLLASHAIIYSRQNLVTF